MGILYPAVYLLPALHHVGTTALQLVLNSSNINPPSLLACFFFPICNNFNISFFGPTRYHAEVLVEIALNQMIFECFDSNYAFPHVILVHFPLISFTFAYFCLAV